MKRKIKTGIKRFLCKYNGVWITPLMFGVFIVICLLLFNLTGFTGFYDPSFITPLFLAIAVVFGAATAANVLMNLIHRGKERWYYGERKEVNGEEIVTNRSREEWKNGLTAFQKFALRHCLHFLYLFAIVLVYMKLV